MTSVVTTDESGKRSATKRRLTSPTASGRGHSLELRSGESRERDGVRKSIIYETFLSHVLFVASMQQYDVFSSGPARAVPLSYSTLPTLETASSSHLATPQHT